MTPTTSAAESLWLDTAPAGVHEPLAHDVHVDVAVLGIRPDLPVRVCMKAKVSSIAPLSMFTFVPSSLAIGPARPE